ncbi:energy transducer TonB [Marinigracilibium pacificum]|uniref:Energy transducer TonB n=1 Tax=Marinigracilibium pacificum TaxID=2729599 RepID=A0A848J086_9BACT|nr:energy transducer TonB [Marinigracilibium pacificum]NMM49256.1 energy transducer TonB [Marinigracilibium pacificum]
MGTLRFLIGTVLFVLCLNLTAQTNWDWGNDDAQAKKKWESFNQALVNRDWQGSKGALDWLLVNAPKLNEELYDKGQLVYRLLSLKATNDKLKDDYRKKVDELSILKSDYFGDDQNFFVVNESVVAPDGSNDSEEFEVSSDDETSSSVEEPNTSTESEVSQEIVSAETEEETAEDIEVKLGMIDLTVQIEDDNSVHITAEEEASFVGGSEAFGKFLRKNLKYPKEAVKNKVKGKVYVSFIVEKDGALSDIKILKGLGHGCDQETLRVIKASPKWKPAANKGINVRQQMTIPILFSMK